MKKILHITSSVNGDSSNSIRLGNMIIDRIEQGHPGSTIRLRDLNSPLVPHLNGAHVSAFYTDSAQHTEEQKLHAMYSDEFIAELQEADIIVIGVPVYNFQIPSTLKAWIDHITRRGITFSYENGIPKGYLNGKQVYLAFAAFGVYSEGWLVPMDFTIPYLKFALGFVGMGQVEVFRIEGVMVPSIGMGAALVKTTIQLDTYSF